MPSDDPPIIVGGGGSTLVWIRKDINPKLVDPKAVSGDAAKPKTPEKYHVFDCNVEVAGNVVKETGSGTGNPHTGFDKKKHRTDFE